jgi:hypothetical protein
MRWLTWTTTAAVVATGAVFAWMAYAMSAEDPLAAVNHSWQPSVLQLHVLVAVPWLVVFGAVLQAHVLPKLRTRAPARRRSGIALTTTAIVMAASGYLLQTAVDDGWRSAFCAAHLAASVGFTVLLLLHVSRRSA